MIPLSASYALLGTAKIDLARLKVRLWSIPYFHQHSSYMTKKSGKRLHKNEKFYFCFFCFSYIYRFSSQNSSIFLKKFKKISAAGKLNKKAARLCRFLLAMLFMLFYARIVMLAINTFRPFRRQVLREPRAPFCRILPPRW